MNNYKNDQLLLELEEIGYPMRAEWINDKEITSYEEALKHLNENNYMIDDKEDVEAFIRAKEIAKEIFLNQNS